MSLGVIIPLLLNLVVVVVVVVVLVDDLRLLREYVDPRKACL